MSDHTPLMKQYQEIKQTHADAVLLFRLGDFYEMFYDDARLASKILQIALTTRDKGKENPVPMCGIPYFASEGYISKLIRAGHKVAVCEQTEEPKTGKGIVRREVVRVVTPGTHTPEHPKRNNYVMSFHPSGKKHGVALADVSTGQFLLWESGRPIEDEMARVEPSEVVFPESLKNNMHYSGILENYYATPVEDWAFDYADALRRLLAHFRVSSLEGFGMEAMTAAVSAGGALISYLEDTQKEGLRFRKITVSNQGSHMFLDAAAQRNLELVRNLKDGSMEGSLLWALDETLTPMGGRFLRNAILRPLLDVDDIRKRHSAVKCLIEGFELGETLRNGLRWVQDIERLGQRVSTATANARDLVAVKTSIEQMPKIKKALSDAPDGLLSAIGTALPGLTDMASIIEKAIAPHPPAGLKDGGIIREGFSGEIDELRAVSGNAKDYIARLEAEERKKTGISSLKVGYNRVFGYYIELTKANLDQRPERFERKQTLAGGERFITPELKELEGKVLGAEERLKALEYETFRRVLEDVGARVSGLMDAAEAVGLVDFLLSLSVAAKRHSYVMPRMSEEMKIEIKGGRHPVLERLPLAERFVPNDTAMNRDNRLFIITGPNMAGKSTYMRQTALILLMAQMGSFVPAEEAQLEAADRIFTRIGASDFLTKGQSTFMVEMIETANILNNATERSLILLDEVGRGTSTFDGISIAWAAAEFISRRIRARTLFATHYNELTELAHRLEGARNYNIAVKEWGDEIIFLRKIEEGPADKSYGIQVARLAGLPDEVLLKARGVLKELEKQHAASARPKGRRQLSLFPSKEEAALDELTGLDIEGLSPEAAILKLKELKEKAEGLRLR